MTKESMEIAPQVTWEVPAPDMFKTLICFDPDSKAKSWIHWLVLNCTGNSPTSGDEILSWTPPSPPSGIHQYIFGLYEHKYPIHMESSLERGYFDVDAFIQKNGLQLTAEASTKVAAV
jgi:phosphatidylethanolamine-binding protein (PEBP) family uncharacterized protein